MPAYQAGSAFVTIAPSFEGMQTQIGQTFGRAGDDAGATFADHWSSSAGAQLQSALDSLPPVEIDADSTEADRKLAELRSRMESLGAAEIGVDLDEAQAMAELAAIRDELSTLRDQRVELELDVDGFDTAILQLTSLEQTAQALDGREVKVPTSSDDRASSSVKRLGDTLDGLANKGMIVGGISAALSGIVPIAATAAAAVVGLSGAIAGLGAGAGVLALAVAPVVKALAAQDAAQSKAAGSAGQAADAARAHAEAVEQAGQRVQDASRALADARAAAAQGDEDAAARTQDAARSVGEAHTRAAEQVAAAQQRYRDAVAQAGQGDAQAARRVEAAQAAVAKAHEDAAERIAAADRQVADSRAEAVRAAEDANRAIAAAEDDLAAAQVRAKDAQDALTRARVDAAERSQDLAMSIRGGALAERSADLAVQDARAELAKATASGDPKAIERAKLAVDQAMFRVDEIRRRNLELAREKAEQDRQGVDGSEQVQQALRGVAEANDGVRSAQDQVALARRAQADQAVASARRVADSEAAAAKARTEGAERTRAAEQALADSRASAAQTHAQGLRRVQDAAAAVSKAQSEGNRAVSEAERRLASAREQQTRQHAAGLKRIEDAQRSLARAEADLAKAKAKPETGGGAGGNAALASAMSKLTPAGKEFLGVVTQIRDAFGRLSQTAQNTALPGITRALKSLAPAFGPVNQLVARLGTTLGRLAEDGARQLNGPFWRGFGTMMAQNLPRWLDQGARILGNFAKAFAVAFKGMLPVGNQFLTWLTRASGDMVKSSATMVKSKGFTDFLKYVRDNGPKVGELFKSLGAAVVALIKDMKPWGPLVLELATNLGKMLAAMPPGSITAIATAIGTVSAAFKVAKTAWAIHETINNAKTAMDAFKTSAVGMKIIESVTGMAGKLTTGFKALGMALITPPLGIVVAVAAVVAALVALYKNNETFRKFVDGIVAKAKELGEKAFGWISQKAGELVKWLKDNWQNVLVAILGGPIGLAVKLIHDNWDKIKTKVSDKANEVKTWLRNQWDNIVGGILSSPFGKGLVAIARKWSEILSDTRAKAGAIKSAIASKVQEWASAIGNWNPGQKLKALWDNAVRMIQGPLDSVKRMIQPILDMIQRVQNWRPPSFHLPGMAEGGMVRPPFGFASGGLVPGAPPARRGVDNLVVPLIHRAQVFMAGLRSGEFVQPQEAVDYYGARAMEAIRRRAIPRHVMAGLVSGAYSGPVVGGVQSGYAAGGLVGMAGRAIAGTSAWSGGGAQVAVLARDDARMIARLASRPMVAQVDGRALFIAGQDAQRRYGTR